MGDWTIIAPANPDGGSDRTARTMRGVMQVGGISQNVHLQSVPGVGGTLGLAQVASRAEGDAPQLIGGGYVMVGAILTNASPVTLDDVTPTARLTGEYEVIVVPAEVDIQDIGQLVEVLEPDPGSVNWAGGVDHIAVELLARAAGVDPAKINDVAFSGGGEALAAFLGSQVTAAISSLGEVREQAEAGTLRILAMSSPERIEGVDAPTLQEAGFDVVVENWRMVAAAPGLSEEQAYAQPSSVDVQDSLLALCPTMIISVPSSQIIRFRPCDSSRSWASGGRRESGLRRPEDAPTTQKLKSIRETGKYFDRGRSLPTGRCQWLALLGSAHRDPRQAV